MKGIVSALSLFPNAGASLIGIFISPFSKDPTFTWVYSSAAVACILASGLFFYLFRKFDAEDLEMKTKADETEMETFRRNSLVIESEINMPY
jgi:proton-dependent oligopeptide transporter, POT family